MPALGPTYALEQNQGPSLNVVPQPKKPAPSVFDQALQQYPALGSLGLVYKHTPRTDTQNMLEFWPPGEKGEGTALRPPEIPLDKPGIETYSDKVRPIDILGDAVSHHMIKTDPTLKKAYDSFKGSLTKEQNDRLKEQYDWAKTNDGEKRPFDDWKNAAGLPAYFRGYAFQQWPEDFNAKAYTPEQRGQFDEMMKYLSTAPAK